MIRKLPLKIVFLFLGFLINVPTMVAQVLMKEVSFEQQIENSTLLIEGRVLSKESFWDSERKNIYTLNRIEVYKVFKGELKKTVDVITHGGVVGLRAEVVSPSLSLNTNDIGVFVLHNNDVNLESKTNIKAYKPYSSSQGFYKYNIEQDVVRNPFNKTKGITSSFYDKIIALTKADYINVDDFDVKEKQREFLQKKSFRPPSSITFTPTSITAGTKSVLTINGSGFGATKGSVGFSDADEGGSEFYEALDTQILTWSDTQITVEVPSKAGTGIIRVTDSSNSSADSNDILTVSYSEINIISNQATQGPNAGLDVAYQTRHVNDDGAGGYTWQMFTGFDSNTLAKAAFLRAFETWRCESGVNWVIGETTNTNIIAEDNINVIRFDVGDELPDGVLGRCTSRFGGCFANGNTSIDWFVNELDIVFNDDPDSSQSTDVMETWNYGTGASSGSEYDFESVALHELGHGHQLAHVIDSNSDVMHFTLFNGQDQRTLGANNILAAADVHSRSTSGPVCVVILPMTDYAGTCGLSVDDNTIEEGISIFPNPAKKEFFIKSAYLNLDKIEIYDVSGRLVSDISISEAVRMKAINMHHASKGVYFVNIHSEGRFITKKLILD